MLTEKVRRKLLCCLIESGYPNSLCEKLENDLVELINSIGVSGAELSGYEREDIVRILAHTAYVRSYSTNLAKQLAENKGFEFDEIKVAIIEAVNRALNKFQLEKSDSIIETGNGNGTSIISTLFTWTEKYVKDILTEQSSILKKHRITGEIIDLKYYSKLPAHKKKEYITITQESLEDFEVYEDYKNGGFRGVKKFREEDY